MSIIATYVSDVLSRLPASSADRKRIEADLRAHLQESVAAGLSEKDAVARMGPPDEVAAELMSTITPMYASPASRFGAMLIDIILTYGVMVFIVLNLFTMSFHIVPEMPPALITIILIGIVLSLLPIAYFVVCEWLTGATLGKWLFGIVVRQENGGRPTFANSLVRRLSLLFGGAFLADGAVLLVNAKRQRATEMLAHTVVLRSPDERPAVIGWLALVALIAAMVLIFLGFASGLH